jgi:hypothetical protein
MERTELLRVRVEELRKLVEISGELSDLLLSALDARRGLLTRIGEGGLVLAGDVTAICTGCEISPSATSSHIERCCAPIGRRGPNWRAPSRCPRPAPPW